MFACEESDANLCSLLISKGVDINAEDEVATAVCSVLKGMNVGSLTCYCT